MIYSFIQLVLMFAIPLWIIRHHEFKLTKTFGTIGSAYLAGIIASAIVFGLNRLGLDIAPNEDIGQIGGYVAISIAIPLLLFSANLKEVRKLSKTVLLSFASVIVSVILVSSIVYMLYAKNLVHGGE
ncbi:MAG: hypothetical protein PHP32_06125, partial [Candidatus Izemoplasmatales bacterium]|nr:hypothetical protein [Candidatus Izemoplasmatales bacterium]